MASSQAPPLSQPPSSNSSHVNQYPRWSHNGRGSGRSGRGRGRNQYSSCSNFFPHWADFQPHFCPSSSGDGILGQPSFTSTKQCQICFHFNHTALECRNRFNHSYAPNLLPKSFSVMNLEEVQPSVWYPDSGASAHMTNNPSLLSSSSPYSGSSQVMVGNGNLLSILSTSTSFLPTSSKPLLLNNVLYVPSLQKNLMSVHRLCVDNNCFIQFTESGFFVKDKKTKQVLLHCKNNGSLYPVRLASRRSCHVALSSVVSHSYLWHQRLGHPKKRLLQL